MTKKTPNEQAGIFLYITFYNRQYHNYIYIHIYIVRPSKPPVRHTYILLDFSTGILKRWVKGGCFQSVCAAKNKI